MFNLKNLLRPHIASITPYSTARDEFSGVADVYLDANENPFGSVTATNFNRYPDPYQWEAKEKIVPIKGCRITQLFLGNGSDEPIDLLVRAFCEPKIDNILIMPPTYGMYEVSAGINNVAVKKVPLTADFQIDTENVLAAIDAYTKILWVCSPNNPSGNLLNTKNIEQILNTFSGIVVIDEAYIDFAQSQSWVSRLDEFPNLVVLQTFSKAWGLAALRLGMAFASEEIIKIFNLIKPPYNINGLTQQMLADALTNVNYLQTIVPETISLRNNLAKKLKELPIVLQVYPSDANFILAKFENSKMIFDYLIEHKVIVRDRSKVINCEGCLRITVGTKAENERMIKLLEKLI